jgi:hypothetical protein
MRRAVFFFSMFLLAAFCLADVYQWTDANGKVHFSDKKPAQQTEVKTLDLPSSKTAIDPEQAKHRQQMGEILQQQAVQRQEEEKARQKASFELAKKQRACANAKRRLQANLNSARTAVMQADGSREYLTAEQRVQRRERLIAEKNKLCR